MTNPSQIVADITENVDTVWLDSAMSCIPSNIPWLSILAVFLLLGLSGFFSGSETSLTAASPALMHEKEKENNVRAGIVNKLFAQQEKLIGSILLGNNLVNILATALTTSIMSHYGGNAVVYTTIIMTPLVLIFAEILPKTYAIRNANKMALAVAPIMYFLTRLFSPVTIALQWIVRITLRIFKADYNDEQHGRAGLTELRGAIDMQKGKEVKHERAMLRSVLDLAEVEVYDVMNHRRNMFSIDAGLLVSEIMTLVLDAPYSRIPVYKDKPDNIVGVLRAKSLMRAIRNHGGKIDDLDIMSIVAKPWFILETTSLMHQLQAFRAKREHFALVVDEYGAIQGVVTLEDVLEEIVGDITDETDEGSMEVTGVRSQGDGSYVIDGRVTIRDLNRRFEWDLPDIEAATIAGFLIHETERIPKQGQKYEFHGFDFEVTQRKRNQITSVRITPPSDRFN